MPSKVQVVRTPGTHAKNQLMGSIMKTVSAITLLLLLSACAGQDRRQDRREDRRSEVQSTQQVAANSAIEYAIRQI